MRVPRKSFRAFVALIAASVASVALVACGSGDGGSGGEGPVRIAVVPGFGSLPIRVAEKEGFFAAHGVDAKVLENSSTASFGPGLGKQFDFILNTPMDFIAAASKGIDVYAVTNMYVNTVNAPNNVLVTKDPSITSLADLKGKRIGVVSMAGTGYGTLVYALDQAGVKKGDATLIATPFPDQFDQLESGNLDATLSTVPFWSAMEDAGYRTVVDVPFFVGGEGSPNTFYSTGKKYAEANPETVKGFHAAIADAIAWIQSDPVRARAATQEWLGLPSEVVDKAPLPVMGTKLEASMLEKFVPAAEVSGQLTGSAPNLDDLVWPGAAQ
ncbi:ABC transporter substrate-binding protein [Rhodococcus globerulus]|uniref:ABC transporter substrate-binding protein n=1 Tax=Rhodococcus globerulus TaxID=33008 RepID=A0ABU4C3N4_RHOGO|nr:ABC transporter substrate-binding protein [Rhodococcus globerulus]MDV6271020.1 ABC transporter substrate-binding protein [Rhodococcus globerulus]